MALSSGVQLGPYKVAEPIGAGGMGEVYRATDTKLGREVAIKTLPSALAADTDRLARFEREAKLLATLNHPNIAVIYGLEEQDGTQCIAMELIEGETLEEKLKDGPLPVEDVLRLALQIAHALEAAHEKSVVHRDLKPANVMVTAKGQVKVLDFGLAKAFSEDPNQESLGQSPALSLAMTQQGMVLGTASYMSPEQASGQPTDQRADVWAFGVVLFEMLSGLPLFTGESVPHILADVLKTEPDWNRLPKNLDPRLKVLLDRCLRKKPDSRYHAIADARIDIEEILADPEGLQTYIDVPAVAAARLVLPWVVASVASTVIIAGLLAWTLWPIAEQQAVNRFVHELPEGVSFRFPSEPAMALSRDGRQFIYNTEEGVYLRTMDNIEARVIPGTDAVDLGTPVLSPDGRALAYWQGAQLRRRGVGGGAPVLISEEATNLRGVSWEVDGTLLAGGVTGVYRVSVNGGTLEQIISIAEGEFAYFPRLMPDGDTIVFSINSPGVGPDQATVVAQSISTGERTVLIEGGHDARYVPTGHLVYAFGNSLFAVAFDPETLTVSSGAVPGVEGVMRAPGGTSGASTGAANYSISDNGTLVYIEGTSQTAGNMLVWVDREGSEEPIDAPPRAYTSPRISPDGTRVALNPRDDEWDIWIWDFERGTLTRLTFDPGEDEFPAWSPDGERIVFSSSRDGGTAGNTNLFWKAADGTGSVELLVSHEGQIFPTSFLSDATGVLTYGSGPTGGADDIGVFLFGEDAATFLLNDEFGEATPEISPDGNWLAYTSDESGQEEIYVRPFPDIDAGRWQVSTNGGAYPLWARDGQELFYRDGNAVMAVSIETDSSFTAGNPEIVFEGEYAEVQGGRAYDVSPDGERFLMLKPVDDVAAMRRVIIVENWFEELRRLAPPSQ